MPAPEAAPALVAPVAELLPPPPLPTEVEVPAADLVPEPDSIMAAAEPVAWVESAEEDDGAGAEIIEFAPVGEMPAGVAADDGAPPPPDVVTIGEVSMPADLYAVIVDEARGHLATLEHELSLLQLDPRHMPSAEMVRASHTLCGIHRAGGIQLIALTAKALEQCLLALQPLPPPLPAEALPALADAVAGLREFLVRVTERRTFNATDVAIAAEIQQELESVRQAAAERAATVIESPASTAPPAEEVAPPVAEAPAPEEVALPVIEELIASTDAESFEPSVAASVEAASVEPTEPSSSPKAASPKASRSQARSPRASSLHRP